MLLPTLPQLPTLAATPALAGLASRAVAFRAALAPADVWTICLARDVFQAAWMFSLFLFTSLYLIVGNGTACMSHDSNKAWDMLFES